MSSNEELVEDANGDSFQKVKQKLKDRSKVRLICELIGFQIVGCDYFWLF